MDKPLRIVIFVVLGLVVFHLVFDLFNTRSNIKAVIKNLEQSKINIDSALNEIKFSQDKLKTMQEDLNNFSQYVQNIQSRVEKSDLEKTLEETVGKKKRDSIRAEIDKLKEEVEKSDSVMKITAKFN